MNESPDRLYDLLPAVYRLRDVEHSQTLRALLQIITEQVNLVEADIAQLYDNWFIETCQDWVVPYIGELIGYQPVHTAGAPGDVATTQGQQRNKILFPRQDVANTIGYRRRRGTAALLAQMARAVAGWPSRAIEFYPLLGLVQALNHVNLERGRTVDLRQGDALDRLGGAFDALAHTVDLRRLSSSRSAGRYNIPNVGVFVWRLTSYPVTRRQAYLREEIGPHCFTFSPLGADTPLFTRSAPSSDELLDDELDAPDLIRRRTFERRLGDLYGPDKSLAIWRVPPSAGERGATSQRTQGGGPGRSQVMTPTETRGRVLVPVEDIIAADLSDWQYLTPRGKVAVDPVLGRIAFPLRELPRGVWVSYHYGFSADIGAGEYERPLTYGTAETTIYRVGEGETYDRLNAALQQWRAEKPDHAIIEINDSRVYVEQISIELEKEGQSLELRAANRKAPVIRLLDWQTDQPDALSVTGKPEARNSCFTLDGIMVSGRSVQVSGEVGHVRLHHCTLVPGWSLQPDCEPRRPAEASLELYNVHARVTVERSIIGSIRVIHDEVLHDPIPLHITNSILDATSSDREALDAPGWPVAHVTLTIARSTVFGTLLTHAIERAENTIFTGAVHVARRQLGCMRFCYAPPGSRTPRRYNCQPDLVYQAIDAMIERNELPRAERDAAAGREALRVTPQFNSVRYGSPTYAQLAETCAQEIKSGADDESEIGVFHDLFQPQRAANLRGRLTDYSLASTDAGIIFVT